ncbi:DNA primase protein [Candidatus Micropelagos thuwalensis]|uniref:DNA repair protein RadA n=1 Tax=Candidatus Micropelagius thuwalensis TaxID=1397666 RepID=U2WVN2_9PROT|nr:DNA repair protein RadA [Candidatus Micropelagos thuwalensis]ERL47588.1 DNA primase protein [Candidatus Micropelagos thuwalensis]
MARTQSKFVCQSCGAVTPRWSGKCESCGAWNTIIEERSNETPPKGKGLKAATKAQKISLTGLSGDSDTPDRTLSGLNEFDRVIGGGFVPGSAILLGGDPGIGKSTILMQAAAALAAYGKRVVYISGEEAIAQLRMRAARLGLSNASVQLGAETNVENIIATLKSEKSDGHVDLVIIDSIQTIWSPVIESAPGTVSQVRASAQDLIHYAKSADTSLVLVGHVTKEGQIAGPRVLEHMVDTVIYFEGDRGHHFRILRAVKNRFGPTDEIGVFEMRGAGLVEVANPSALFLEAREDNVPGSVVFAGLEGTRPLLVEIQALAAPSSLATPRRAVVGWDSNRLSMVLAVLEARCGISFAGRDVFLNIAGGLKVNEPAADLAVAAALISSICYQPLAPNSVTFGEISLSGAIRPVSQTGLRLKEAAKLGFHSANTALPANIEKPPLEVNDLDKLTDLLKQMNVTPTDESC